MNGRHVRHGIRRITRRVLPRDTDYLSSTSTPSHEGSACPIYPTHPDLTVLLFPPIPNSFVPPYMVTFRTSFINLLDPCLT